MSGGGSQAIHPRWQRGGGASKNLFTKNLGEGKKPPRAGCIKKKGYKAGESSKEKKVKQKTKKYAGKGAESELKRL